MIEYILDSQWPLLVFSAFIVVFAGWVFVEVVKGVGEPE